ncbi:MAG: ATP-binding cassette domain-containing protein [Halioglobus sp.]
MPLLRLESAALHYGTQVILDAVNLSVTREQKIGLLGRNGAGKTTLLKALAGDIELDGGTRWQRPGTRLAWLRQELPQANDESVFDHVAGGLEEVGNLLAQYHRLSAQGGEVDMAALARVQTALEARDGWAMQQRVDSIISRLALPAEAPMSSLSGGWRRRVALARALVNDPDVLLLDEPTNHLDIPAIRWLEEQIREFRGAVLLITHDRQFLQSVCNVMAELERGHLTLWEGDYHGFLRHRDAEQEAEERANALFDKRLAQEEVWIRQGIKARRTRNEGRVRALKAMRDERAQRRERQGRAEFAVEDAERSGKRVVELEHVSHAYGGRPVISDFSTIIQRGDRIGIVGANGAGKTTLVKILLGELTPDSGTVTHGTRLEIAYSDQLREKLDPGKTLIDNVCGGQEFIEINGRRRHGISYLGDFLFTPERVRTPVRALSGGEQNRAVLARLFSRPANLLVLDEPTNDLDMETLELLEEILLGFEGTVLLVSHDRVFMDNVLTSLIVLDGKVGVSEHVGGYSDWVARGGTLGDAQTPANAPAATVTPSADGRAVEGRSGTGSAPAVVKSSAGKKLSYKEQRELAELPLRIEQLESRQTVMAREMEDASFYAQPASSIAAHAETLAQVQELLEQAIERWAELEERS